MNVTSRTEDGVVIVAVEGRVHRERARLFKLEAERAIGDGWGGRILFDCEKMTYISTAGLREVLLLAKKIASHEGRFAICSLAEGIDRAFEVIGFDQIIDIHKSPEAAMASFSQGAGP